MSQVPWNHGDGDGNSYYLHKFLSDTRHNSKFFTHINVFNPYNSHLGKVL